MPKKPTAADAQLILQLYDLRREAEIRKARTWWATTFWPSSAEELIKLANTPGQENAWFRQVAGYWEMAASLVLRGALNEDLFYDSAGELWFIFAKVYPYLKEVRQKLQAPEAFQNVEKLATHTRDGRERLERMLKRVEARRKLYAETAKAS
jgi:hypothetical protein